MRIRRYRRTARRPCLLEVLAFLRTTCFLTPLRYSAKVELRRIKGEHNGGCRARQRISVSGEPGGHLALRWLSTRVLDRGFWTGIVGANQPDAGGHGAGCWPRGSLRSGGFKRCLRSSFGGRRRSGAGAALVGALRRPRRARAEGRGPAGARRRIRSGGDGPGRYAGRNRPAHFDDLLVPLAPGRGAYLYGVAGRGAAAACQNVRFAYARSAARAGVLVRLDGLLAASSGHPCTRGPAQARPGGRPIF